VQEDRKDSRRRWRAGEREDEAREAMGVSRNLSWDELKEGFPPASRNILECKQHGLHRSRP
jgi:hypothetical protein